MKLTRIHTFACPFGRLEFIPAQPGFRALWRASGQDTFRQVAWLRVGDMASLEQEEARTRPLVRPQSRGRGPGQASLLLLRHKHRPETMNPTSLKPITYPARPLSGGRFGLIPKQPVYLWSAKLNGWRAPVHVPTGTLFNRQGEELSIAGEFAEALENLSRSSIEWLDCEALERRHNIGRGCLVILDAVVPNLTAAERYMATDRRNRTAWLADPRHRRPPRGEPGLPDEANRHDDASRTGKLVLSDWWGWMQHVNKEWGADFYEGFVAKRADSLSPIQLRNPESHCPYWTKHRFDY